MRIVAAVYNILMEICSCSSDSVLGSIVLMIVYGYLLLRGAQLLSNGSELLLEVISPGIIGGKYRFIWPAVKRSAGTERQLSPASRMHPPVSVWLAPPAPALFVHPAGRVEDLLSVALLRLAGDGMCSTCLVGALTL